MRSTAGRSLDSTLHKHSEFTIDASYLSDCMLLNGHQKQVQNNYWIFPSHFSKITHCLRVYKQKIQRTLFFISSGQPPQFLFQAHLLSVFDNTKSVKFHEKDYEKITAIVSKEEETIELDKPVMAQGRLQPS